MKICCIVAMNNPRFEMGTNRNEGKSTPSLLDEIVESKNLVISRRHRNIFGIKKFFINYIANNIVYLLATAIVRLFGKNK